MDKNNQYGNMMKKTLPSGYIKKMRKIPTLSEFNAILNKLSHWPPVYSGYKISQQKWKTMLFNEIYMPIFEKHKIILAHERSVLQLISVLIRNEDKDIINSFKSNSKTHLTVGNKKFIPLYAEHIHFLVTRAGWLFTKIYQHFTFKQ